MCVCVCVCVCVVDRYIVCLKSNGTGVNLFQL